MFKQQIMWALMCFTASDYWMNTCNLSAVAPYTSKAHSGRSSSYLTIKFNLSLDFGRKVRQIDMPGNTPDDDSGILTITK